MGPAFGAEIASHQNRPSVRLAAIVDPGHSDGARGVEIEKHTPLPDAEPKVAYPALKLLHVPTPGCAKPLQSGSHTLLCDAVEAVEIAER
jgi:hypothetical protein